MNPVAPTAHLASDVRAGRLDPAQYAKNFCDAHPPLNVVQANIEAERCYYCYDAPCQTACPTGIDIPTFIRRIADGNLRGAARTILEENPLGGMCARVCPTEVLCEQACVRNTNESKPVEIGLLQRHATDAFFEKPGTPLFVRAADTGRRVAVVGAGPAGLACAHRLAVLGHQVVLFDARPKLGGLNEYGLASYKTVNGFAQREIEWLLSVGGIEVRCNHALGRELHLDALAAEYDAVFLGLGLAGVNALGLGEQTGVRDAVDFIAELRQAASPADVAIGRHVVVIGGGMTAVDAAVQSRKLGAEDVSIVYRRGQESMGASADEQSWAKENGVRRGIDFARTALAGGKLVETGESLALQADMVLCAIGQSFIATVLEDSGVQLQGGRISTDTEGRSSRSKVWAGGDARFGGRDLTVEAVEDGKQAALSIDRHLRAA